LIGNAIKFTDTGRVEVEVSLERENESSARLRCRITDSGIGISPEAKTRLFQSFVQADGSTTRRYGGTGLGLAICKELVTKMQGEIDVESQPGVGSTFWFTVDLLKQPAAADEASTLAEDAPTPLPTERNGHRASVLIAEDNVVNQRVAAAQLKSLGFKSAVAANGLEVLEALGRDQYEVVLMDCNMPELDGYQTTRRIRSGGGHQPFIIAMTANAIEGDRDVCVAAGMNAYITKPMRKADLEAALSEAATARP
ncbi:MAG TPA: ATP-binding protein, partial [Chthoniobacterales bacterium]|nr:ATP-binding protein [Chthoniobacterales bacterium]